MFDIVINKGYVEDPGNRVSSKLNIGILDGKIAEISHDELEGRTVINGENLIVAPGFIDIHMHEDSFNEKTNKFDFLISHSMLKMGVTTVLGGNCGIGPSDLEGYVEKVREKGYPINIGMFVPHECLRNAFGSFDKYKPVTTDVIEKMAKKLRGLLKKGFYGLSFGVEYIPGMNEEEMLRLAKVCAEFGGTIAVHVREDGEQIIPSILEAITLGEKTGAPIQISHIGSMGSFGNMSGVLSIIDEKRSHGVDVVCDCYPYDACCTHIGSTTFDDGFLERYDMDYSGLHISGKVCTEEMFKRARQENPKTLVVAHIMKESDVDMAICHSACITASDGIYVNGQGHPRGSGTFPRLINRYVKEKKSLTITQAIEKITSMPADRFNLKGKGRLSIGADADITIFNLEKIRDMANYESPLEAPVGIEYVIIDGKIAVKGGEILSESLGRYISK